MIIYIQLVQPLETKLANRLETFAEVITLFLLYTMMSFTDVEKSEMRYEYGKVFIGVICTYVAVHVYLIAKNTYYKVRHLVRKAQHKLNKMKKKRALQRRKQ